MRKTWIAWLAAAASCLAQQNPFTSDAGAAESGRPMFRIFCSPCHGIKAEGGRGPDLTLGTYSVGDRDADLFGVIVNGATGTEMPAYSSRLRDEDVWRIVSYIRSVARRDTAAATGNREAGRALFWGKGQCGQCHLVDGKGGRMGPDLSRMGRQRSLAYLKESIVDPNADLTPGYYTISVVTRDGKKLVGVQRGFDNFSGQFMDVAENFYSFQKSDVKSMKREFRSMMPDYRTTFSPTELNDVVAYLASLRGEVGVKK